MKFSAFLSSLTSATFNTLAQGRDLVAQAVAQFQAISAIFAAASLNADEIIAGGTDSLKQKIDALNTAAVNTAIEAKVAELSAAHATAIDGLKAEHVAAISQAIKAKESEFLACFQSIGVTLEKFDPAVAQSGLKARAETMSHELLAARGMKPLPEKINATDEAIAAKVDISTPAKLLAHYESLPLGTPERAAFFKSNESAIWAAWKSTN